MAIADDLVGHAHIAYLGDPFEQYCGLNGKPLIGGCIEVYHAGTDTRYITMQNFDGAMNPFKIPLNADGRVVMLADPSLTYDIYVKNSYGDLVCSRLNVECTCPGNISISGADTSINNTDGTLDVSLRTLGNNVRQYTINTHNKVLDVQDPLYFVENSNTATVIGFSGDGSSSISGKMDESKLEYNAYGEISAYNGSAFASQGGGGGAGDPEVNALVHSTSATWNDVSAKLDTTAFSTVSGNFLTAIPDDYSTKDYVQSSVSSKLDSTAFSTVSGSFLTAHQDLSDYLTKVSADGSYYPLNSNPSGYLTAHQDLSQYAKTEDLTAYQEKGDYYSASNPSGFLTKNSADTLYQPTGDYATHDDLTAYQPSGNYADATALDGKVDTSSFTAFSSTTNEKIEYISGALSGTYELSAGEGIDITDYPNEQKTVISARYNETVLYDGGTTGIKYNYNIPLSESYQNFEFIRIMNGHYRMSDIPSQLFSGHQDCCLDIAFQDANTALGGYNVGCLRYSAVNDTTLIEYFNRVVQFTTASTLAITSNADNFNTRTFKVWGINRVANN